MSNITQKIKGSIPNFIKEPLRGLYHNYMYNVQFDLPRSIHIDPANLCNFRCEFCPTGDLDLLKSVSRPSGTMSLELFSKIMDDIKRMCEKQKGQIGTINLYKDGEPLINKNLNKMVDIAKKSMVSNCIQTTTNASLLTKGKAIGLIESGLDRIRISVEHVSDEGYKKLTKKYSNYDEIRENVAFMFNDKRKRGNDLYVYVKILDTGLTEEDRYKFIKDFKHISDEIHIDSLMGWSLSTEKDFTLGNDPGKSMSGGKKTVRKICTSPFTNQVVNFDGTVSCCCVDWSHKTVVGNLNKQSFHEIWNGEMLREFRLLHIRGERSKIKACRDCDYMAGIYPVLDSHKNKLLAMCKHKTPTMIDPETWSR